MTGSQNRLCAGSMAFRAWAATLCLLLAATGATQASGVVNDCAETALNTALSGGGTVTFACDGVIVITNTKTISANTVLDASGRDVTISGFFGPNSTNAVRLFFVNTNISLTLINLKLVNGRGSTNGGAIYNNGGTVVASNCVFAFNNAVGINGGNGAAGSDGGNGRVARGGAIYSSGKLSLDRCLFQTNSVAGGNGGKGGDGIAGNDGGSGGDAGAGSGSALHNDGSAYVFNCTFSYGLAAGGSGGAGGFAFGSDAGGRGGRGANGQGGAIHNAGYLTNHSCTFMWNSARGGNSADVQTNRFAEANAFDGFSGLGGAVSNAGTNSAVNSTFHGNSSVGGNGGSSFALGNAGDGGNAWGGNLYNQGRVAATNCTLTAGSAVVGIPGAVGDDPDAGFRRGANIGNNGGVFILHNTILAYPTLGGNGFNGGTLTDGGFCISSDLSITLNGPGSRTNTNPVLGPLTANGGPTLTLSPLSGSPAIDSGDTNFCLSTDQRGLARPAGPRCDIGAVEVLATFNIFPERGWASEAGDVGVFSIYRSGYFGPVTIQYAIGGTAGNGVDYVSITNAVTLGSNVTAARVLIRPLADGTSDNKETVSLTLSSGTDYVLGPDTNGVVTIYEQSRLDLSKRYFRGTGTTPTYHSVVVPLDFQSGVRLADTGGNGSTLFPGNPWTNTLYHFDATNPAAQTTITGRCDFQNPIVAFGSRVGGTPLHVGQTYRFGVSAGINDTTNISQLRLKFYSRTNFALLGTVNINVSPESQSNSWHTFSTNGYSQLLVTNGLTTVITRQATPRWGAPWHHSYILTHTATTNALPYVFEIESAGYTDFGWTVLDATNGIGFSKLYTMEVESRPPWRATFIHQPHFAGQPLPPAYQGKSAEELLTASTFLATNPMPSGSLSWSNLDASPELRRHRILDQLVSDLNRDPIALANYVFNEIELTDAFGYDDDGNVAEASVNLGGVNRGALATYQEGQGSPIEQCALLVYLLRQAGYPAAYMFPAEDSLKLLDLRLSSILRLQLRGDVDDLGQTLTTNRLIAVNYPWVAAYIGTNWVHLFPWMKDTEVVEGLGLYDYMPTNYNNAYKWVRDYLYGRTNLLALNPDDDTPSALFPKYVEQVLLTNAPGVSLDDIGVRAINRRNYYARWADFPKPTIVGHSNVVVEHLSSSTLTNLSPTLTNLFDTVSVEVYSVSNPSMRVVTGELRMADLHNRKLLVRHEKITSTQHRLILSLAPYSPGVTNEAAFSSLNPNSPADPNITNKLTATMTLDTDDDGLKICFLHKRQRTLPTSFSAPHFWDSFPGFATTRQIEIERPFRKGDLAALCLNPGRVTRRMLQVHAEEQWQMEQQLGTNSMATNSLPADLYQGTPAYLKGMAYYEKVSRFIEQNERLHKVRNVSWFAAGLARLNAARNGSGQLPNGDIDLTLPTVDMFYNQVGLAGNGSLRPDSGQDDTSAQKDFFLLAIADGSAQEHAIINQFLIQKEAVSTVKLLRLAQQRGTNGQPGIVLLTKNNYLTEGEKLYPTTGDTMLKEYDPQLWTAITDTFESDPISFNADYSQVFITPWPVTNATASYSGMAALVMTPDSYGALISGGINGGTGENLPAGSFGAANTPNADLNVDSEGNFSLELDPATAGAHQAAPEATATFDVPEDQTDLNAGVLDVNPNQVTEGQLNSQILDGQSGTYAGTHDDAADRGTQGRADDRLGNGYAGTVADPVNTVTGEFYVDAVDLTLPGPMPLQVRRNYGSHNLSRNQLGYGWKLNYMPYLTLSQTTNFYVSEPDGSVLVFTKIGTDLWAPTPTNNPTLNNYTVNGMGSVANRLNARMVKIVTNSINTYFLTNADGSLRIFEEKSFPLSAGIDRLRPYLTTWLDHRGNFYRFEYGTNSTQPDYGQVRRILSSSGNLVGFQYDVYGRITEAYTLDGRRTRYRYDRHGDLVEVILPDASEWRFEYEHLNWTTNSTTYIYSTHLMVRESKPDGRALWNDYDDKRRVTNQAATVGSDLRFVRNATFRYTNNFNLTNLTATLSGTTTVLDYTNRVLRYFYTNGLMRRIVDPLSRTNVQTWYEVNETNAPAYPRSLKTTTDKRGLVTEFKYDERGNVTNATVRGDLRGDGDTNATAVTVSTFNANNLPTTVIDPTGTTNLFFYTNTWLLARVETWPSNSTPAQAITNLFVYHDVTNAVDGTVSDGLRQLEVRAAYSSDAATNELAHDSRGFVTRALRYTGTADPTVVITNIHNGRGELIESTDAAGRKTRLAYDARGRLEHREVFEAGQSQPLAWEYSYYNPNGELVWSDGPRYDPEDYVWRDYDGDGRLCAVVRTRSQGRADGTGVEAPTGDVLYSTTFYDYDPFGNQVRMVNPRGIVTTNSFDAVGQLLSRRVLDTNGAQLTSEGFAYEPGGLVARHTNALGGVTETLYTSTGKPCFRRNADGSTNGWTYYANGRPRREIRHNGSYWETTFDDANRRVTRVFYSAGNAPLATNIVESDRRGNVIRSVDAGGFVSTNQFDGLDRIKIAAGPAIISLLPTNVPAFPGMALSNVVQQTLTYQYDASGQVLTVTNALGEKSIVTRDALGRVVRAEIWDATNATIRLSVTAYAANHHGSTTTNGSGAGAIVSTAYTDNEGNPVLAVAYPSAHVTEIAWQSFDVAGNRVAAQQISRTNSQATVWATNGWTYDGLNRVHTATARDGATTTFDYDPAGNVTNRAVPGGIVWRASYNGAGQPLQEYDSGGGLNAHTNLYTYYPSNSPYAGLLQTNIDGRRVTCLYTYDDWLRPATNAHSGPLAEHSLTTVMLYDARGLLTNTTESFNDASIGPTNRHVRRYDAYRQLESETILTNGALFTITGQGWDAAGRRTAVGLSTFGFAYAWRPDGLLAASQGRTGGGTYSYDAAGQLVSRIVGPRATTISSRDGTGRPLTIGTLVNGGSTLSESLSYTGDGLIGAHTVTRPDFTDQRAYAYAEWSRRLTEERLNLDASARWTNAFAYDSGVAAGPGVLTKAGPASTNLATWSGGVDGLSRIVAETNTAIRYPASGRLNASNGTVTVNILLDGQPQAVTTLATTNAQWPTEWRARVELSPGTHQLTAQAVQSSSLYFTNTLHWLTNSLGKQTAVDTMDSGGYLTQRIWKNPNGTTNRTQTFSWDGRGRLVKVIERDAQTNGLDWTAVYDALGRRLLTRSVTVTNGTVLNAQPTTITVNYDPEYEFLELGVAVNGKTTWKLHGPDLSRGYGSMNGLGGFDAIVPGPELFCPTINDARGNVLAVYDQTHGMLKWNASRPSGYGAVPGSRSPPLGHGADLVQASAWRGRWMDVIGSYQIGLRAYLPESGTWASPDPLGHNGSDNLRSFCFGDPVNIWDSDGRVGRELYSLLEREYWQSGSSPYFQNWGNENNEGFHTWLDDLLSGGAPAIAYQPPVRGRSLGASAGHFAVDAVLNADLLQQSWREFRSPDFSSGVGWATFGVATVGLVAGTVDAAANVLTLGGKSLVTGSVKAGLKEAVEVGAKETLPMFSRTAGQAMDPAEFARIKSAFERTGGVIDQSAEGVRRLDHYDVEASTLGNYITLRPGASRSAVFEELIHATQNRLGRNDWSPMSRTLNEIEAQEKLIRFRHQYRIPNEETRQTIQALRDYREKLQRLQNSN